MSTVCIVISVDLVNSGWNKIVYVKDMHIFSGCWNGLMKKLVLFIFKYFSMVSHCEWRKKILGNPSEEFYSEWLTVGKFLFFKGNLRASVLDLHVEVQQSKA